MAGPANELDCSFHVRSISMPSRPQPLALPVEEELQKLRAYMATSTSFATPQLVCYGLRGLEDLYDCIKDAPQHSSFNLHQKKWMENELNHSIRMLDLCTLVQDTLAAWKWKILND